MKYKDNLKAMSGNRKRGFTLVELVLVIILVAILASIAVPRFVNLSRQADLAATRGALGAIRGALVMDYASRTLANRGVTKFGNALYTSWFMELDVPVNEVVNSSRVLNAGDNAASAVAVVANLPGQLAGVENISATNQPTAGNLNARGLAPTVGVGAAGVGLFCCATTFECAADVANSIAWVYESFGDYEGIVKPCGDNSDDTGFTDDQPDAW